MLSALPEADREQRCAYAQTATCALERLSHTAMQRTSVLRFEPPPYTLRQLAPVYEHAL